MTFDKSVLNEAVCHQLNRLDNDSTFNYKVGLLNPHRAGKKLATFIRNELDLSDDVPVDTSSYSKHNALTYSAVGDMVLLRADSGDLIAGQVLHHFGIMDEFVSVLFQYELVELDRASGCASWRFLDSGCIISTGDILDSLIWCQLAEGMKRTIIPREYL